MTTQLPYARPPYYRLKAGVPLARLPGLVAGSAMLALALGAADGWADFTIGMGPFQLVVLFIFPAVLGYLLCTLLRRATARGRLVALAIALPASLLFIYAAWIVWLMKMSPVLNLSLEPARLAISPGYMQKMMAICAKRSGRGYEPSELTWFAWLCEALTIIALVGWGATAGLSGLPYCANCSNWCTHRPAVLCLMPTRREILDQHMSARDLTLFEKLGWYEKKLGRWVQVDLFECPCGALHTMRVMLVESFSDKRGYTTDATTTVADLMLLEPAEAESLELLGARLSAAANRSKAGAAYQLSRLSRPVNWSDGTTHEA